MPTPIPQGELYVSHCEWNGSSLSIRFVTDYDPESAGLEEVLVVRICGVKDAEAVIQFLLERQATNEAIYVGRIGEDLSVESEFGVSIEIQGEATSLSLDTFNAKELREILAHFYACHESAIKARANLMKRINACYALAYEQARRIKIKATGHTEGSTAATLYSQQMAFIDRILALLESSDQ